MQKAESDPGNEKIYIDFMARRPLLYLITAIIVLGTPLLIWLRPLNLGMDFRGGTEYVVRFQRVVEEETIRKRLSTKEFDELGDVQVYRVVTATGESNYSLRTKLDPTQLRGRAEKIIAKLSEPENKCSLLATNAVGPVVGEALRRNAFKAIFMSLLVILLYIAARFEYRPGVLCTLKLVHDTLIMLGLFALTQGEMDLTVVASILTVLGYSMNDSIVILDRIRENHRLKRKLPIDQLVTLSINQCLGRTLYTGITVSLTLITLLAMGPVVLRNFALAMLVGIFAGTFSTVSVVCPLLVDWTLRDQNARQREKMAV